MKNKEKFAKEIFDLAIHGYRVAMKKDTQSLCACRDIACGECEFFDANQCGQCRQAVFNWAESEYVEPKEFTEEEKEFIRLCSHVQYVARDEDGMVWGYNCKPAKSEIDWATPNDCPHSVYLVNISELTCLLFESVKFEDAEPTSREEILR